MCPIFYSVFGGHAYCVRLLVVEHVHVYFLSDEHYCVGFGLTFTRGAATIRGARYRAYRAKANALVDSGLRLEGHSSSQL